MISAIAIDMINHWYCYRPYLGMGTKVSNLWCNSNLWCIWCNNKKKTGNNQTTNAESLRRQDYRSSRGVHLLLLGDMLHKSHVRLPGKQRTELKLPLPFKVWENHSYLPVISLMVWA